MKYYFITAVRNLLKNKGYALINITGLSVGLASFFMVMLYVRYEKSFDTFHEHHERIFRVQQDRYNQNALRLQTVAANAGVGEAMATQLPEVETFVRIHKTKPVMRHGDISFKEEKAAFVTRDFFKVFTFPVLQGDPEKMLTQPYAAVLSESTSKRYFKGEDPIGKILNFRGEFDLVVSGVFRDAPHNSHLKPDILISYDTYFLLGNPVIQDIKSEPWRWDGFMTYVLLNAGANPKEVEKKLPAIIEAETGDWLKETNQDLRLHLQPITSIHLFSAFDGEWETNGSGEYLNNLQWVAVFLLITAWINYMSLATTRSLQRSKEVGIRKVLGSHRWQLMLQFLAEAAIIHMAAVAVAFLLIYIFLPSFNAVVSRDISTGYNWEIHLPFVVVTLLLSILLSGAYPSWVVSSYQPVLALKGQMPISGWGKRFRKLFTMIPFSLALLLISCLYIIYLQISHMKSFPPEFSLNNKLVVRDSEIYDSLYDARVQTFKTELQRTQGVDNMTYVSRVPGEQLYNYSNGVRKLSSNSPAGNQCKYVIVDENFVDVLNLRLLAGHAFTQTSTPRKEVILNENAADLLGFSSPDSAVNEWIVFRDDTVLVKAVVNDFHFESLKNPVQPVVYSYNPAGGIYFVVTIDNMNVPATIERIKSLFTFIFPAQPFIYYFLDDQYNNQYKTDVQFGKSIAIFSGILIILSGLGLFGLATHSAALRTKEVAIRKVLGATSLQMVRLLVFDFLGIVIISCVIGVGLSWYLMDKWLSNFHIHIEVRPEYFLLPCAAVLIFTFLVIAYHTLKASLASPVSVIKDL